MFPVHRRSSPTRATADRGLDQSTPAQLNRGGATVIWSNPRLILIDRFRCAFELPSLQCV